MALFAIATLSLATAACPSICSTSRVWGFGGAETAFAICECTYPSDGSALRTGPEGCVCYECHKEDDNKVIGYGKTNGQCRDNETDCSDCDFTIAEPVPTTSAPVSSKATSSTPVPTAKQSTDSGSGGDVGTVILIAILAVCLVIAFSATCVWYRRARGKKPKASATDATYIVYVRPINDETPVP